MAYTKTQWVNNTTPINDTNLNKIEQGIYDNSLVADAVTNTLNPTDTETYKTAELTEGQITDVIGVSDIVIKGQASQDGTPTPSAPVNVNVVSGNNVIKVSNENLFVPSLKVDDTSIHVHNATVLLMKDEYTFIASGSDMYFGEVANTGATYLKIDGMKIYKNGNTKLSFLVTNTTFNRVHITAYNSQGVSLGYTVFNGTSGTYTFPENCEFVSIRIGKNTAVSGTTYKTKVVVVYGDTIPTTYQSHQDKELSLDLPIENLLKISGNSQTINGITFTQNDDGSITAKGTATANATYTSNQLQTIFPGKYKISGCPNGGSSTTYRQLVRVKSDETTNIATISELGDGSSGNFTAPSNVKYILGEIIIYSGQTVNLTFYPQVERGSKANIYTPYGTESIELCKIGNYQDYFYKSGSKWYLHKEMTFEIRTSEDNWQTDTMPTANPRKYVRNNNYTYIVPANNDTIVTAVCNYPLVSATNTSAGTASGVAIHPNGSFYISADVYNNLNLSPIKMYIPLITPIDTEITDATLISQLEAIYNAPLYEETNITQTNNDLPMVLDITACKDNINGIKAFIRK